MYGFRFFAAAFALVAIPPLSQPAVAQGTGRITGTVSDSGTARPLLGAVVSVRGTRLRAVADDAGRFTIAAVPAGMQTLETRRIGYRQAMLANVQVTDGGTATVDIRLAPAPLTLEAIVTTGLVDPTSGTRAPFTVGRLDADNAPVPATNALETIQGKIAGVTVVPNGQAGGGTNIMLRTPTSINKSNSPLIVVDGVVQAQSSLSGSGFPSFGGASADLESLDIESVEVVKGAAAASIYGSRAQSGVIQIRTRRGSGIGEGVTRTTARTEVGSNSLAGKIDWASHHYYRVNTAGQYIDSVTGNVVSRAARQPRRPYERFQDVVYGDPVYDHVDRFYTPGQFYKNAVNVAQNAGRTNWFLSYVNSKEDGVVLNAGAYAQNDLRLNLDHYLRNNLRLSFSGYHSRSSRQELYGDTFFDLINQAPDLDLRMPDADGVPYAYQPDTTEGREENPLYVLATEENNRKRTRTQGNIDGRYSPLSWLSFDGNVSYDRSDRRLNFFLDQGFKTEGFGLGGPGEISQTVGNTDAINAAMSANLLGRRGVLTVRSTLRGMIERERNEITQASGEVLSAPGVRSLDNAQQQFVESNLQEIRSNAYLASLGADFDGRYILDGLVRRDGSSLFGPEEWWNTYYRVSGAYRVSQESWWRWPLLTEFKLRASRGTAGGRPDFDDQFETFNFISGGGLEKSTLGNKFLKPEHSTETEVGLDAIVRNRYSLQLSYARNKVVDQLIQIPLASFFGYTSQWQNAGTIEGNTLEMSLEADVVRRPEVSWRLGIVADRGRHKVTEFKRSCFQTGLSFRCAGETLGAMYGFRFIKAPSELPTNAQANASEFQVNDEGLLVWVGTGNTYQEGETKALWGTTSPVIGSATYGWGMPIKLKDAGGSDSVTKIGDGNARFRYGLSNSVNWRNWSMYGLVDVQMGGNNYNQTNQRMYQWARSADVDQNGKQQELKKPIEYYVSLYSANDETDYFVENAGFVKLRELSVRYQFGRRLNKALARVGASDASVSLVGRNLLTFTNYKGYDPEVGNAIVRLDSFDYPRYRTITGSFQITF
jgi:TonB-linked SusC/RagA family outer membrane protein